MEALKVSVITPTYKRSDYLNEAIDSVLSQTYQNIEIIVVDDNGNESEYRDKTRILMEQYADNPKVQYVMLPKNVGGAMARNAGIEKATGDLIAFLDDDDKYLPMKTEVQVQAMQENGWDCSVMDGATYDEHDRLLSAKKQHIKIGMTPNELMKTHLMYHISGTNTFMFKAESIRKIGGFMDIVACQEYMLMLRALKGNLTIGYIPETLIKNYIREGERLSSGSKKYIAEKIMYKAKKENFSVLTSAEKRYVTCRHYGVLFYVQLKRKKIFSALGYAVVTFLCSPSATFEIFKDYKGKLFHR